MASKLYVSEYTKMAHSLVGNELISAPQEPPEAEYVVDYTAGVTASQPFSSKTKFVRIHTDSICSIAFGANPTATTSNKRLAAGATEYFGVVPTTKVSAITNT